ncbi:MAG: hypothetical protein EOS58_26945 [Mesorhizobium sp.]|uniref:hypothetical protein n=1 Tax=unclassified Mesorhizobium TaxID=325217 RepID=UPI000F763DCA|nr:MULTISPECIES: hypothetical protein [unclassified Mesorhizobium]RUX44061.1 hypothetical protein EOA33_27665 [Mesorhizobium sp. M4A.F.Ca.ET.050.02.1.1]AZO47741.1 hypothetical protein EJ073_07805 [Mesorhizobium sp. M4B.F.Ca.ET.058.02.1.1]RVC42721.1 hypothetical protein EN781_21215 [Mesorhizobium sp. M4A.F.Ca.ET.090.04.2.1]RVC75148.1 hypothetical protein EN745_28235 [Mesorhizobium sp. M4A.F.Ca.ET.022.05.2.1]RWC54642.1 MAG: hypothetical protein EOS54_09960 [Mesorhizobium sp.]
MRGKTYCIKPKMKRRAGAVLLSVPVSPGGALARETQLPLTPLPAPPRASAIVTFTLGMSDVVLRFLSAAEVERMGKG